MVKGFNSDVSYKGLTFHVQTEDWGADNPYLVSRVFQNGAVVKSIRTAYAEVLPRGVHPNRDSVSVALKVQHSKILDLLLSGQLL